MKRHVKNSIYGTFNLDSNDDILETSVSSDTKMFLDPLKIDRKKSNLAKEMSLVIADFYIAYINDSENVLGNSYENIAVFKEPYQNHLGYCSNGYRGNGGGSNLIWQLRSKLKDLRDRNVQYFRHMSFACDRVSDDVTSDLTTRIVFKQLAEYTLEKCRKYNLKTSISSPIFYWDHKNHVWQQDEFELPITPTGDLMIFIPESICSSTVSMSNFKRFARMGIVKYMMRNWSEIKVPFEKFNIKRTPNGRNIRQDEFIEEMKKHNFDVYDFRQFLSLDEDLRNKIIDFYEKIGE